MSRFQIVVLFAGIVTGILLALAAGSLTRADVLTPVLAIGLTAPLGWAGMEMIDRRRSGRSGGGRSGDGERD